MTQTNTTITNGNMTIQLQPTTEPAAMRDARELADDAYIGLATFDKPISWHRYVHEIRKLCDLAEEIVSPESGLDIFKHLTLTKQNTLPKNKNVLLAQILHATKLKTISPQFLQHHVKHIGMTPGLWLVPNREIPHTWDLKIQWHAPATPIFDLNHEHAAKTRPHQVWLAELAYRENNPKFKTCVKIINQTDSTIQFRNLESEEPFDIHVNTDMHHFKLLKLVKD